MPRRKATDSEVHAYQFIKDELRLLGWDVRSPERADAGQVWTQHEALHNPAINESLKGRVPENVVKVTSKVLWIFEAKPAHKELEQALKEAEEYAQTFQENGTYQALLSLAWPVTPSTRFWCRLRSSMGRHLSRSH